jgi:pimeloyl-ACP methyl ester carboxylesterase
MLINVAEQETYVYSGGKTAEAGQPAIVFIHGAQQDHSCWVPQSRWFAHHGYAVLTPDLPGHGRSAGAPLPSVEALADWVIALLDAAGHAQATLVGHSLGSLVALAAAARHPQRVSRLALVGTSAPMPVSDALLEAARNDENKAFSMVNRWSHSQRGLMGGNAAPGMWMLGMNLRLMERQQPGTIFNDLAASNSYLSGMKAARAVRCPVLIVAGSRDLMTPARNSLALAQVLAENQADVRVVTLPEAGHAFMAEQPNQLLDVLIAFAGVRTGVVESAVK